MFPYSVQRDRAPSDPSDLVERDDLSLIPLSASISSKKAAAHARSVFRVSRNLEKMRRRLTIVIVLKVLQPVGDVA